MPARVVYDNLRAAVVPILVGGALTLPRGSRRSPRVAADYDGDGKTGIADM